MRQFLFLVFFGLNLLSSSAQNFNIVLGRPTGKSITMNILFDAKTVLYFEYGTLPGNYTLKTAERNTEANVPAVETLSNLISDTKYFYRVNYKLATDQNWKVSPEYSFQTWRPPGKSFSFTIEADPHPYDKKCYHPLWDIALANQLAAKPDFMIDMGDTHGDDHYPDEITSAQSKQLHLNNRVHFGGICHSVPLFFCLGNHEGENGYYLLQTAPENLAVYSTIWRKYYYNNPVSDGFYTGNTQSEPFGMGQPENYYAWEWGDALFVVLDAYRYYTVSAKPGKWDWTIGKMQYDWLKQTLETSKAKYKFVFAHHVMGEARGAALIAKQYEWGSTNAADFVANRPGWEMPIHQLMVKNKVNMFIQGHDHLFAREELDGIIYQEVPMPSDSSYSLGMIANAGAYGGIKSAGSGHLKITVAPEQVNVDYVLAVLPEDETPAFKNGAIAVSYAFNSNGIITSVDDTKAILPQTSLKAWPNPFRDSVNIQFELAGTSDVKILSYDISGRMIDSIDVGTLQPGKNLVRWDATKGNGKPVPKGIYNCVIETSNGRFSQKLILN